MHSTQQEASCFDIDRNLVFVVVLWHVELAVGAVTVLCLRPGSFLLKYIASD